MADDGDLSIAELIRRIRLFQLEEDRLFDRLIVALAAKDNPQGGGGDHGEVAVVRLPRQGGVWTVSDFEVGDRVCILNPNVEGQDVGEVIRKTAQRLVIRTDDGEDVYRSAKKVILLARVGDIDVNIAV